MHANTPHILLVEDDVVFADILKKRFEAAGATLVRAETGKEAMEAVEKEALFDVILLDIALPDMDGFEVLKRLREVPAFKSVPVVIVSNFVQDRTDAWGASMGVDKSIQKSSVMPGDIVEMVLQNYPRKQSEAAI